MDKGATGQALLVSFDRFRVIIFFFFSEIGVTARRVCGKQRLRGNVAVVGPADVRSKSMS